MKIAKNVNNLGTELVYDIFSKTKKLEAQGKKIIDLSLGQSAESPPEHQASKDFSKFGMY